MKKLVILLAFITLNCALLLLQSCDPCDGPFNYKLLSITSITQKLTPSGFDENFHTGKAIRFDSVGIVVTNDIRKAMNKIKGSWINQSFACDPVVNYEYLDKISIISSEDYNADYPKGSELKTIMKARSNGSTKDVDIMTIESGSVSNPNIIFLFNEAPSENKTHNITIKYKIKNGSEFQTTVVGLKLNK